MNLIIVCLYSMLPAYFANMVPVLVRKIPKKYVSPIDFGIKFHGKRITGDHKTWNGAAFGIITGIIIAYILSIIPTNLMFDFVDNWLIFGLVLGLGVIIGDLIKSIIKRRIGIKPGDRFFPWDQLDSAIGVIIFMSIIYPVTWQIILIILITSIILHILINHIAFYTGIRGEKW